MGLDGMQAQVSLKKVFRSFSSEEPCYEVSLLEVAGSGLQLLPWRIGRPERLWEPASASS